MELFGTKLSFALGAWRLRFVLMLEETEDAAVPPAYVRPEAPHHFTARTTSRARAR